jgi:hypothetical protein
MHPDFSGVLFRVTTTVSNAGIERVSAGRPVLQLVPDPPAGQTWAYQIVTPFQVSPTQAALSVNMRVCCNRIIDLEAGGDLMIVDSLRPLNITQRMRLVATELIAHPRTGEMIHMSTGWGQGGFVPLGAKRENGSPHPHAGTGFLLVPEHGYPAKLAEQADTHIDLTQDTFGRMHLFQIRFDGSQMHITHRSICEDRHMLPDTHMMGLSMAPAIPDGDDLVVGMNCGTFARMSAGFTRWRRGDDGHWAIVDHRMVDELGTEPSIVRDPRDGALLMSIRPALANDFASPTPLSPVIYRSTDGGRTWAEIFRKRIMMANSPVKLHRALDGTLYIVANRYQEPRYHPMQKRDALWLHPLSDERTDTLEPLCVRDTRKDFGPSPYGKSLWRIDHPVGVNLRFADGQWRHWLCYRGLDDAEMRTDAGPTDWTGSYIEEVVSRGEPRPYWRF